MSVLVLGGPQDAFVSLSPSERETVIRVARGRLRKQIAHDIGIAEATVKVHRMRAVQKMTDALSRVRPVGRQAQAAARNAATLVSTTPCATRCGRRISGPAVRGLVEPVMRRGL